MLSQLKDIQLPAPVAPALIAPGWIALGVVVLWVSMMILWGYLQYRKKPKVVALKMIKMLEKKYYQNPQSDTIIPELSEILRRVALCYYPREQVAGLTGRAWLEFLDKTCQTSNFVQVGEILTSGPYEKSPSYDCQALFQSVYEWVKQCR